MFRSRLCLIVVLASLAMVLEGTAALKGHVLLTSPFADILSGTPLPLLWLATFAELAVVAAILSRLPLETKWLITSTFFLCLAAVSLYNVLSGKTSCGCAGALDIHPAWFLGFNLLAVGLLAVFRPERSRVLNAWREFRLSNHTAGGWAAVGLVALGFSLAQLPSVRDLVRAYWFGHSVVATPVDLGTATPGLLTCELTLRNVSHEERKIVGYQRSCQCVVPVEVVQATIPARGVLPIRVDVKPKSAGRFHQQLLFFLDSPQQHVVAADIHGFVVEKREERVFERFHAKQSNRRMLGTKPCICQLCGS